MSQPYWVLQTVPFCLVSWDPSAHSLCPGAPLVDGLETRDTRGEQLWSSGRPLFPLFSPQPPAPPWLDCCSQGQSQRGQQPYLGYLMLAIPPCQALAGSGPRSVPCSPLCQAPPSLRGRPHSPNLFFPRLLTLVPGCMICPALGLTVLIQLMGTQPSHAISQLTARIP